jgi:arginine-tRNA-protein transferase
MYKASRRLTSLSPEQLDDYLSRGWFRMVQTIFTTQFVQEDASTFKDAIWLRYRLKDFEFPKWYLKMKARNQFRISFSEMPPSQEHEALYQVYWESKPSGWPESLDSILSGQSNTNVFPTSIVNVYDEEKLIAAGCIDIGKMSAAGIVNFFNPAYAKYSLGKFLFLLKIDHAIALGLEYFYPGYFVPGNPRFDYKLEFHQPSLEFFQAAQNTWLPYSHLSDNDLPMAQMEHKLYNLFFELVNANISCCLVVNAAFSSVEEARYDSPFFILIPPISNAEAQFLVIYDTRTKCYEIFDASDLNHDEFRISYSNKLVYVQPLDLCQPHASESGSEEVLKKLH